MGTHPLNLFVRFLLEMLALVFAGIWGWHQSDSGFRILMCVLIPGTMATIWGVFAVPNDPSRLGKAPIRTPGFLRLLIELAFFGFAIWALSDLGWTKLSLGLGLVVMLHYITSYDRVLWLMSSD